MDILFDLKCSKDAKMYGRNFAFNVSRAQIQRVLHCTHKTQNILFAIKITKTITKYKMQYALYIE
jgi:hypothetical protein